MSIQQLARWRREHPELPRFKDHVYGSHAWLRQCGGKIAYFTFAAALRSFYEIVDRPLHNEDNSPLTIYRCGWCDWFHLGHLPRHGVWDTVFCEIRRPNWAGKVSP